MPPSAGPAVTTSVTQGPTATLPEATEVSDGGASAAPTEPPAPMAGGSGGETAGGGAAPSPSGANGGAGGRAPSLGGGGLGLDAGVGGARSDEPITLDLFVAEVFSGHPVSFALVTFEEHQFVAYYDSEQRLTVASRQLGEEEFTFSVLPSSVGWDSHNSIAMAVDETGHVHVSGNMHNVPLIYFRTTTPLDVTTLTLEPAMVGRDEGSVTYPEFFIGPEGNLVFIYRDGGSGSGNHIFDSYDANTREWSRLLETPLTDGQGQRNAYPVGPIKGPDLDWHLVWVWRDSPDASTNHDLSYARTTDLVLWESGAGTELALPITLGSSDVVDPVPVNGGMINNNTKVGFDAEGRPVVAYHKFDEGGATQLYNARLEGGSWVTYQTSDWDYRWEFGGEGTLEFPIELEGVVAQPDGSLTQRYFHSEYGGVGAFRLDPETLAAVEDIEPPLPYPKELDIPTSPVPEMGVRWKSDFGADVTDDVAYLLRWETLPSNRDMPRVPVPAPTELRLYGFRR
jgi:hypothetical protein